MRKPRPPAPRHRHHAQRPDGAAELGYRPVAVGRWMRTPPTERGIYCVVSREGGLWLGSIALHSQSWAGWWWSERISTGMDLTRLPPAPSWNEPDADLDG